MVLGIEEYGHFPNDSWGLLEQRVHEQPENIVFLFIFIGALIHTFIAPFLLRIALKYLPEDDPVEITLEAISPGNKPKKLFSKHDFFWECIYFLGEIEVVFGLWTIPLGLFVIYYFSWNDWLEYINSLSYREASYLMVSMAVASTYPIVHFVEKVMGKVVKLVGGSFTAWWWVMLTLGPLFGGVLKDISVMTIISLLLLKRFYKYKPSYSLSMATMCLLFVNISVSGALTNFASATSYLVAGPWKWTTAFMFQTFGLKTFFGVLVCNTVIYLWFRKQFQNLSKKEILEEREEKVPFWVTFVHLALLGWIIVMNDQPIIYLSVFVLFLGFYQATKAYQTVLSLRVPFLIAFFVASLIVHVHLQGWWVEALEETVSDKVLPYLAAVLTAFCHNTTVAYLATFVPKMTEEAKIAFFSGAVSAGGLTLISSSANVVGYKILGKAFKEPVSPLAIFYYSLVPTFLMFFIFIFLF